MCQLMVLFGEEPLVTVIKRPDFPRLAQRQAVSQGSIEANTAVRAKDPSNSEGSGPCFASGPGSVERYVPSVTS